MTKPFVLYDMKDRKGSRPSKRMRASMQVQKTQCEWLESPSQSSPESALAMAVLQRAVMDLITPGVSDKDRNNAHGWITGAWGEEHEKDYPFSFSRIVESYTELEVSEFREKILVFSERAKVEEVLADGFRFQRGS
jgi:hypothetical protein